MNKTGMKRIYFRGKFIKVTLHFIIWAIFFGFPIYFSKRWEVGNEFIWVFYINVIIWGIIFYGNYLFLLPKLFFKTKRYKYYISVLALILCFYFVSDIINRQFFKPESGYSQSRPVDKEPIGIERARARSEGAQMGRSGPPPYDRNMHFFSYMFSSVFLIFFSLVLKVLERQSQIEKMQKETERERLNSELAFLKNQISPHFFFNTLNNIYSLISINAEDSQKAVLKLSKLMRYLLYESEHGNTNLSSEIDFMNNYIDLMKLRMSDKVSLNVSFPDKFDDKDIPPLLFIPFVENSFKHGISYREKSFISISMTVTGNSISFRCVNSLAGGKKENGESHLGIGLENVKKRLSLLFPGNHDLKINKSEKEFEILLVINLS
jgi:two-component system, LytTR family, sensor kinase